MLVDADNRRQQKWNSAYVAMSNEKTFFYINKLTLVLFTELFDLNLDSKKASKTVLCVPQLCVQSFLLQQLFVGSPFADFALFENKNLVGIHHRREAMSDADAGAPFSRS